MYYVGISSNYISLSFPFSLSSLSLTHSFVRSRVYATLRYTVHLSFSAFLLSSSFIFQTYAISCVAFNNIRYFIYPSFYILYGRLKIDELTL